MDASQYRNVVLGLIFLQYVSDSSNEKYESLINSDYPEDAEDRDMYTAENIFWLPKEGRWDVIAAAAKTPEIGETIDKAMEVIERENGQIRGVLPRNYASPDLDKVRLGGVIDLISNIKVGDEESRKNDVLGRVYEYFLSNFAAQEGKNGGEFYTPRSIVRTLVEMLEPYKGRIYDSKTITMIQIQTADKRLKSGVLERVA